MKAEHSASRRSSIPALIWLALIVGVLPAYSLYLDLTGLVASGKVTAKRESIRVSGGDWSRSLSIAAAYQPDGERVRSYVQAEVDAETFDNLRIGSPVTVKYLPSLTLRQIPLIPAARLAGHALFAPPVDRYPVIRRLALLLFGGIALAILWQKAHLTVAAWLLIPYVIFGLTVLLMPRSLPAPAGSVRTTFATINDVHEITEILETDESSGISAIQPYQIVETRFVPEGRIEPVLGVDMIDSGSVPAVVKGAVIAIDYQADNPRILRIQGASRTFPEKAYAAVLKEGGEYVLIFGGLIAILYFFRSVGRNLLSGWLAVLEEARARKRR
jgi:hypothetical protein